MVNELSKLLCCHCDAYPPCDHLILMATATVSYNRNVSANGRWGIFFRVDCSIRVFDGTVVNSVSRFNGVTKAHTTDDAYTAHNDLNNIIVIKPGLENYPGKGVNPLWHLKGLYPQCHPTYCRFTEKAQQEIEQRKYTLWVTRQPKNSNPRPYTRRKVQTGSWIEPADSVLEQEDLDGLAVIAASYNQISRAAGGQMISNQAPVATTLQHSFGENGEVNVNMNVCFQPQ